ncbi:Dyp-type peroxidase [Glaciimonas immobilis]|uniref:Dyp-type peroxidase family n=1 Tax=Glaciimonas immobilis TaxID=728004 RepID=A0A840RYB7_9BURK|nr:peroxidase [Glaciimonas immobilis]KAF3998645.1 peroxidase [Glaciimonas immobilis]MBB5201511.1 Dyp-type peroxidase family [Glaciimonas immobilis]
MTQKLDLMDIQGNVVRAYGRFNFPVARYLFLNVIAQAQGRKFITALLPQITSSANWGAGPDEVPKPAVTTNIAFTYEGLKALGLPGASLIGFQPEFMMGMKARKDILGDDGPSAPEHWDAIWQGDQVHIFISLNAQDQAHLEKSYQQLLVLIANHPDSVMVLEGHRGDAAVDDLPYQDASVLRTADDKPTSKEHFGYTDGIGDPVFEGLPCPPASVNGRGKQTDAGWLPLATGEFILGHLDEAKEYPAAPSPVSFARNGSFLVYRKLHQNVGKFNELLDKEAKTYPGGRELLAAKFIGRWRDNGAPLASTPDQKSKNAWDIIFNKAENPEKDNMLSNFTFDDDREGAKCPFSSHLRRINPRASMELDKDAFDTPGALSNRRRILRRGLPYGIAKDQTKNDGNHGIIMMMINVDINRQFEFIQQQWINYGNDFGAGNDKEIILGNHNDVNPSKAVIQVDPDSDQPPYFVQNIPRLVETRGGDYFFIPGITALRLIAKGLVDPT